MSDQDNADRPATFREVLASGEYRALYLASALSWFGDYVARAAVTALVFQRTESVAASAATFAISYVPWLGLGPILAALAERLPYRQTMITTDLIRMVLIALVALPGMPVWGMVVLLFTTALCNPPFDAARSALLAKILTGDRYVVGLTLQTTSHQAAQVAGYMSGAGLSAVAPEAALLFNAATFGLSALLLVVQIRPRPPGLAKENRTNLLRETASGLHLVFSSPLLRGVAILVFLSVLFAIVPEGLAAAWAADLAPDEGSRGWVQGSIMVANPVGFIVGGVLVGRLLGPKRRQRLIRVFAIAIPATLAPAVLDPPIAVVLVMSFLCGAVTAGLMPATNGLFVQALPNAYRARAFGVMKSGIQVLQGVGVFVVGWLADRYDLSTVVGLWALFGVALMAVAVMTWPNAQQIAAEVARTTALNKADEADEADEPVEGAADPPVAVPAGHRPDPRPWPPGSPDPRYGEPWGTPAQHGPAIGRARVVPREDVSAARGGRHAAADPGEAVRPDPTGVVGVGHPVVGVGHPVSGNGTAGVREPDMAAADAAGDEAAGRHSAERRRIARPVGRIYSTESARNRVAAEAHDLLGPAGPGVPRGPGGPVGSAQPGVGPVTAEPPAGAWPPAPAGPPGHTWPPAAPTPGEPPRTARPVGATREPAPAAPWPPAEPVPHPPANRPVDDPVPAPHQGQPDPPPRSATQFALHQHAVQQHSAHQHAVQQQRPERSPDDPS